MRSHGFTIIELLIASVITLLLLGIASQGLRSGAITTRLTQDRKVALEDLRTAGNYIADQLSLAYFIYPSGSRITLNSTNSTFNYTLPSGSGSAQTLTVGNNSVAAILPPVDTTVTCSSTALTGCLRFFAAYTVPRSSIITAQQSSIFPTAAKINSDSFNPNDQVLMVYWAWVQTNNTLQGFTWLTRDFVYTGTGAQNLNNLNVYVPTGNTNMYGSLLADYLAPTTGFTVTYLNCLTPNSTGTRALITGVVGTSACPTVTSTSTLNPQNSISQLQFTLTSQIARGGLSTAITPLQFQTASRNLILQVQK